MTIDIKHLESLLEAKKYDEVRVIITEAINQPISDKEKGAMLTGFALTYLDIMNSINIQYRDALKQAIAGMELINKAETKIIDQVKLEEVKKNLGIV